MGGPEREGGRRAREILPFSSPIPTVMNRGGYRSLVAATMGALLLAVHSTGAAARAEPLKIGVLTESWGPTPAVIGLRDGLVALGLREGEQFLIGVRFTQGDVPALAGAAREVLQAGADIIFAPSANAAKAAQGVTSKVPIVFGEVTGDVVGLGLVRSLAQPGGNVTGVTNLDLELGPKRLELFAAIVPGLKRVLFPYQAGDPYALEQARVYRKAAQELRIALVERPVRTPEEARAVLAGVRRGEVDGIVAVGSMALNIPGLVLNATSERMVPTMFSAAFLVEQGGLVGYGPDFYESGRQAARLVTKIIRGEKPGRIPVETNPKIELVLNAKVARTLGLEIGPAVLLRVDRLIE